MKKRRLHPCLRAISLVLAGVLLGSVTVTARVVTRTGGTGGSSTPTGAGFSTDLPAGLPNPQERLQRTAQALQAVKQMQAQARAAAVAGPNNLGLDPKRPGVPLPDVPNGLVVGGLQVDPAVAGNPALWAGAKAPVQTVVAGQTKVTVEQNAPQAILNWETFNIGKETTLKLDQSAGGAEVRKWIAFNKVNDPAGVPSQILGKIEAPGQVYVINPNGIIFGGSAQINVSSLIAAALPINDNLVAQGLLNNPDTQFLFTALPLAAGANGTPTYTPPPLNTPDGLPGDVEVQPGAQITTPTTVDHVGGRVMLVGANVRNAGEISTPDGQTILAAGLQVGVGAHSSSDPSLRGLDVLVGAVRPPGMPVTDPAPAGRVCNDGLLNVPRGNVTMVGAVVDQNGFIDSTTSVALNGRVDLLADYDAVGSGGFQGLPAFFAQSTGVLTLGPSSVTRILPQTSSDETAVGTTLALGSQINLEGLAVHLGLEACVLAPNATVTIRAGKWWSTLLGTPAAQNQFINPLGLGQVYLDAGALVDVGGTMGEEVPVQNTVVAMQLNAAELADSPLQRDGLLRGKTIYVDSRDTGTYYGQTWVGTPLANAAGYVNLIQRTAGELTAGGGTVSISAGDSVVLQTGSRIDVSGGWIKYLGGEVPVTRLVAGGQTFSLPQATPDRTYDRIVNFTQFEEGYVQGKGGGAISVSTPALALDGNLVGKTYAGPRQQQQAPSPSRLALGFGINDPTALSLTSIRPNIIFQDHSDLLAADPFALDSAGTPVSLRADRRDQVVLSPALIGGEGFGVFQLNNGDGNITVPAGVELRSVLGGTVTFVAANLSIDGAVVAPGGGLSFTVYNASPLLDPLTLVATPAVDPTRGQFLLGPNGRLSVAGTVGLDYTADLAPARIDAGTVSLTSYSVDLAPGSVLDASGGVITSGTGKRTYGKGGNINISAGQDPLIPAIIGGQLTLNATLRAHSGSKGGVLNVLAPLIQVGGATANPDTLLLSPDFFSTGGFSSFSLRGIGASTGQPEAYVPGVLIAPGTVLAPRVQNLIVAEDPNGVPSLTTYVPPDGLRTPVSLTFGAVGVRDGFLPIPLVIRGDVLVGAGASISTDPQGAVILSGDTVAMLGSISAPGGTINITGGGNSSSLFLNQGQALPTVHIGPASVLSVHGATVLKPNALNFRIGSVLPGGKISVAGNIFAEAGAVFDVSGTSGTLDLAPGYLGLPNGPVVTGTALVPTLVESDGGSINLSGGQQLICQATLNGAAGGATAIGGNLTVSCGRFYNPLTLATAKTPLDISLIVSQTEGSLSPTIYPAGETAIGHAILDANNLPLAGVGYFAADRFQAGGFDSLTLRGVVNFSGPVHLAAHRQIALADKGVMYADADVHVAAPYLVVGTAFQTPQDLQQLQTPFLDGAGNSYTFAPTYWTGNLTLEATSLLDVGWLSLQGIGQATLAAIGGDIRGNGIVEMAGHLTLRAGQIYPPTSTRFTIAAYDYTLNGNPQLGSVTIEVSGSRQLPLSAGGTLSVFGSTIVQNGVLRAPLGTIRLGWDGTGAAPGDLITGAAFVSTKQLTLGNDSVTSVSAVDPLTGQALVLPYGIEVNGIAWIDPVGTDITRGGVTAKSIRLSSGGIEVAPNAQIDIRGGGELYAYQWVSGNGGSQDILASSASFAVLPGYLANYAPYAPYNSNPLVAGVFGNDPGYVNKTLSVGDQVYLQASPGLAAGNYTLLPARYALLPGAFLVTPMTGIPVGETVRIPGGSSLVTGYRFNGLDPDHLTALLVSRFQVSPATVVQARAEYVKYSANQTLATAAAAGGFAAPRLPRDAGQLVFLATQTISLDGQVLAAAGAGGLGGLVDISSSQDILIAGPGVSAPAGVLVLPSLELSAFGAESLLIGGVRRPDSSGTRVTVQTGNLTVDNAGGALVGLDMTLVAKNQLTLAPGANIASAGTMSGAAVPFLLGQDAVAGSGNGALLRVSADPAAAISRFGVNSSTLPALTIGAGASVTGPGVLVDSTRLLTIDSTVTLRGTAVSLASGRISLALTDPGLLPSDAGLVLSGPALANLQGDARTLSLTSYTALDTYGVGQIGQDTLVNLALHAREIRGFNQGGGTVTFAAQNILLDNRVNGTALGSLNAPNGTLAFAAGVITLGENQSTIQQFAEVNLRAAGGLLFRGTGTLTVPGGLTVQTPLITGATAANQTLIAGGAVSLDAGGAGSSLTPGLGGQWTLIGSSIADNTRIRLPSGILRMEATAGDMVVGSTAQIDLTGTTKTFYDQVRYTDGGQVTLQADLGALVLAAGSVVDVSAPSAGGNAGRVALLAGKGTITLDGTLAGIGGTGGTGGSVQFDVGSLTTSSLAPWNALLNTGGFTQLRSFRVRSGDVLLDGWATAHNFTLSADSGSITVTGTVDARGPRGGAITLAAAGSLTLQSGASLTVAGVQFDGAGKGGSVFLTAGQAINGTINSAARLDLQNGVTIDLSVTAAPNPAAGQVTGTLHLRAPQTAGNLDLALEPINGTILNASRITVEGYALLPATTIDTTVRNAVFANGGTFAGNTTAIANRLLANNAALAPVLRIRPGAEIFNAAGDLTLNTTWDLSSYRFGPQSQPGILTLRAAGNLNFDYNNSPKLFASLSDGFAGAAYNALLLPAGNESWSYRLVAGADVGAADLLQVKPLSALGATAGSVLLGRNAQLKGPIPASNLAAQSIIPNYFQVIRTGMGDIEISAGRDIQLLSPLAAIYTAGTQADPLPNFDLPNLAYPTGTTLGARQYSTVYPAQYSFQGGNITLRAQNDIVRYQINPATLALNPDSTKEMPSNWLYRRGFIDPGTGAFGQSRKNGEIASTTWWVDYSFFFEDVGALGGGNVSLIAGRDVSNVAAVIPTNGRLPQGTPTAASVVELGGGDLRVQAGRDINGGTYYVERGAGALVAGNTLRTNPSRAVLDYVNQSVATDSSLWLATTLFLGKGTFDIAVRGDALLGPVANPFLLPQGINNSFFEKSYFSTYATDSAVNISSLTGTITLKDSANQSGSGSAGSLFSWYQNVLLFSGNSSSFAAKSQPWLRLVETKNSLQVMEPLFTLMPPTLHATTFVGDLSVVGSLTLAPSATGDLEFLAAGAINGFQPNGVNSLTQYAQWDSSRINLSDADPSRIPSITAPISLFKLGSSATTLQEQSAWSNPLPDTVKRVFQTANDIFNEAGAYQGTSGLGTLQKKFALHAPGLLHTDDPHPVRFYAVNGDISGLTLFSAKASRIVAGQDLTDIALYLQNVADSDISVVSAGRDIIAYQPNSLLRSLARLGANELLRPTTSMAGDIQINGPGTLEVLAGRNLDLGVGPNFSDGTGFGITSIGNTRNPFLPFAGASIVGAAGIGSAASLGQSPVDFSNFITQFLDLGAGAGNAARYLPSIGTLMGLPSSSSLEQIWNAYQLLPTEEQSLLALNIFYLALRDAGRDHNRPDSPGYRNYDAGFAAIKALFPSTSGWNGDITLTSREIKTTSGGDISLLAPGGQLVVGYNLTGNQSADQGVLTESGGNIAIFTHNSAIVGVSRIFTLRGGNIIMWSSTGDIAAGAASKTVQSAPPTRVLIDTQSADVQTDLAGLATGGGIGVLATVIGVPPGDVDLIAPAGAIDAGDAGIRVSGNINLAAQQVLNVGNIQAQGASAGVPAVSVTVNVSGMQAANTTVAATTASTGSVGGQARESTVTRDEIPSFIAVEVLGYGGGDGNSQEEERREEDDAKKDRKDNATLNGGEPHS